MVELEEPAGWTRIPLGTCLADLGLGPSSAPGAQQQTPLPEETSMLPLRAFFLQLAVLSNHQNGRDTHVREVRVYGPRVDPYRAMLSLPLDAATPEFAMYTTVR